MSLNGVGWHLWSRCLDVHCECYVQAFGKQKESTVNRVKKERSNSPCNAHEMCTGTIMDKGGDNDGGEIEREDLLFTGGVHRVQ